jgi:SAM-dependent methyltransferase
MNLRTVSKSRQPQGPSRNGRVMNRPPDLWEAGCLGDPIRNEFVIPALEEEILQFKPKTIIDIGCGTGFISRMLAKRLSQFPIQWHLLDNEPSMLRFAQEKSKTARTIFHHLDLCDHLPNGAPECDLGFIAYTFLDVVVTETVVRNISALIKSTKHLLIFMPDVLEDVIHAAQECPALLQEYRMGHCSLEKLDKFTRAKVFFEANRVEHVIGAFVNKGFKLIRLRRHQAAHSHIHYCLEFEKSTFGVCTEHHV